RPEQDPTPHAEAALPHLEDPLPLGVGHLVPGGDVVVGARADDAEGDAPHRDADDEVGISAERLPALDGERDARDDRDQQRQPVQMDDERAEVERAARRRRDRRERERRERHAPPILPAPHHGAPVSPGSGTYRASAWPASHPGRARVTPEPGPYLARA